ncbi:hypothetical protein M885DRAFT_469593 [Pelagophyceae sp. CCMP2097]|nr:hypothetical protein M885DRAFT_469593 [Pelagophyceae sp. CCMP2097]
MSRPVVRLVRLPSWPVGRMLELEEALLRHDSGNWILVNALSAAHDPTVVLGLGGKAELLCDVSRVRRDGVDVLRRFTGGGTVVVGPGTVLASLVFNFGDAPCAAQPRAIMAWSEEVYAPPFRRLGTALRLRENDYCVGDAKVGGNAQRISKMRWVHHTSFLWDYDAKHMDYLTLPPKRPEYRADRQHTDFLSRLRDHVGKGSSSADFADALAAEVGADLGGAYELRLEPIDAVETFVADLGDVFVPSTRRVQVA